MPTLTNLIPNLMVADVRATVAFYRDVFGFTPDGEVPDAHDPALLQFGSTQRGSVTIFFQSQRSLSADVPALAGRTIGATATLFISVDDVDALFASFNGRAEVVVPLHDTWYGQREVYVKDNNGYILCFAQSAAVTAANDAAPNA